MGGLFRRGHGNSCCDTGCGDTGCGNGCCGGTGGISYGPGGAMIQGPGGAERIPAPKDGTPAKMPDGKNPPPVKGVQINVVPNAPVPTAAPALESAPAIAPAPAPADADNREQRTPF